MSLHKSCLQGEGRMKKTRGIAWEMRSPGRGRREMALPRRRRRGEMATSRCGATLRKTRSSSRGYILTARCGAALQEKKNKKLLTDMEHNIVVKTVSMYVF